MSRLDSDPRADAVWECEQARASLSKLATALAVLHFYGDYARVGQMGDYLDSLYIDIVGETPTA
jgi:hypothetical protein